MLNFSLLHRLSHLQRIPYFSPCVASNWKILSAASKNFTSTERTPKELEEVKRVFRTLPSYEESISSKDIIPLLKAIGFVKPQEAYLKYVEFTDKVLGERFELKLILQYFRAQHDPSLQMNEYMLSFDRDNDGYITKEEFEYGMETIRVHDPRIKNISYYFIYNLLKEADTNKDGKLSVAELRAWLNKNLVPA